VGVLRSGCRCWGALNITALVSEKIEHSFMPFHRTELNQVYGVAVRTRIACLRRLLIVNGMEVAIRMRAIRRGRRRFANCSGVERSAKDGVRHI